MGKKEKDKGLKFLSYFAKYGAFFEKDYAKATEVDENV